MLDLVALLLHLVAADDQLQAVLLQEVLGHVGSEGNTDPALGGYSPLSWLGVAPQHLRHQPGIRGLLLSVHSPDRVQRNVVLREEASVDHEDLVLDDVAERQEAEGLAEELVEVLVVLLGDLSLEAVELVHASRLVVPSCKVHVVGVQQLPCKQNEDNLDGERASVNKVTVEEVGVGRGRHTVDLPDVHQVVVLPVHVATDGDLAILRHIHVYQGGAGLQEVDHVHDDRVGVLLGDGLLLPLPLHQLFAELRGDFAFPVDWAIVAGSNVHAAHVDRLADRLRPVARDGHRKLLAFNNLLAVLQLGTGVPVLRRQLAQLGKVLQSVFGPPEGHVC
mmetsp:Transcript_8424/g.22899  ORF Transcript_8424/g.22899 Transcript_8424/m.22899 type:complete len:334 (-) Transcript_8424:348-1349(-)